MKNHFVPCYDNGVLYFIFRHTVYDVIVKDAEQAKFVNDLENHIPIDIWMNALPGRSGQILVSKDDKQQFLYALEAIGVEYSVYIENVRE